MLGARFENNGARFRVWAPNADQAFVAYDNHWDRPSALELTRDGEYFEGFLPGAAVGIRYKFIFIENGREVWRIDPASRDTTHSGLGDPDNGGFVVNPEFNWPPFRTPRLEDLIIYQLHVGTFAGMNDHFAARVKNGTAEISFIESKLDYIKDLGFSAIELLPIQEFQSDRSWGYNPSFYYSVESAYGSPDDVRRFVARAHERGLAVIFDVVYNHVSDSDNSLWNWEIYQDGAHGEYLFPAFRTDWGWGPAFQKQQVRDFFIENAFMLCEEYRIDGLRFDATRAIERNHGADNAGWKFLQELTWRIKEKFPDKYLVAEHLEDHDTIVRDAGMSATWFAAAHHEFQRAAQGEDSINKLKAMIGKDFGYGHNYPNQWNLVKYCIGSHDDCGDDKDGDTLNKPGDWERHRYFVEFYGGRDNWYARAKARLGWALNIAAMGTPMIFMGLECHHWGYWHDTADRYGDHRFNWAIAGDWQGMEMRRLVAAANFVRWTNPCLRSETLDFVHEDYDNDVLAFKRYVPGGNNCVLIVVNIGNESFGNHSYGVRTGGQFGRWTQVLCTQDAVFGGWDGAGNAFHEPWTQSDGMIYINVPQWSVTMMRLL
jgi:1,4-alpha-glucan branching enzyme